MTKGLTFGAWLFWMSMRYCGCTECYGRFLFHEKSFFLMVQPKPVPEFYAWSCRAGWYVGLGWFRLFVRRSK